MRTRARENKKDMKFPTKIPQKWKKSLAVNGVPVKSLLEVPIGGCLPAFGKHYIACPGQICEICDLDCDRYWAENQEQITCESDNRQDGQSVHFVEFIKRTKKNVKSL